MNSEQLMVLLPLMLGTSGFIYILITLLHMYIESKTVYLPSMHGHEDIVNIVEHRHKIEKFQRSFKINSWDRTIYGNDPRYFERLEADLKHALATDITKYIIVTNTNIPEQGLIEYIAEIKLAIKQ